MNKKNLRDYTYPELVELVSSLGEKPFRAAQIYSWVYHKRAASIDEMTDIAKSLRAYLSEEFHIGGIKVLDVRRSVDGTTKFLTEMEDGVRVESVLIPDETRLTLCVSTQAGCALGCRFCLTGASGFIRNLTLSELAGQLFAAYDIIGGDERITNIVLMGMGEPLANYDNVMRFLDVLTDPKGMGISHNKVTVSTAGLVPAIERFGRDANVALAVSLNATTDEVRDRLMPINRKYPIGELLGALRRYPLGPRKRITIEYVLVKGVNDSLEDARRLAELLRRVPCKINLIPFNPHPDSGFEPPDNERVRAFHRIVMDAGYIVIVRSSKGADILAACGQLRGEYET